MALRPNLRDTREGGGAWEEKGRGDAKMQVYERERGEILADSERGGRKRGKCELVGVERG